MSLRRLSSYILVVFAIVLIFGVLAGIKGHQISRLIASGGDMPEPSESVAARPVELRSMERTITALGTVQPFQGVRVAADLPGIVREIHFESGQFVSMGDVLVKLDTSVEEAELASAQAQARLAKIDRDRVRELFRKDAVAKAELDAAEAFYDQSVARVGAIEATIARKTVHAPFDGQLGIREVQSGQFLNSGQTVVSLQNLNTVYVEFTLPQQRLEQLVKGMNVRTLSNASPDRVFEGALTAIQPDVDPRTRNVRLQATFSNGDGALRPGMFVRVELVRPGDEQVLLIPGTAILYAPFGDSVFVIGEREDGAKIVRQRFVRRGSDRGDFVVITDGLEEGELVVTDGAFKLRNNLRVIINNDKAPEPQLFPQPDEA